MYLPNTAEDVRAMLTAIGATSIDELFDAIPGHLKRSTPLDLPEGLTELELDRLVAEAVTTVVAASENPCFLGGGAYDHFIPAAVDALASDPDFVTAYTPYQAEASQGSLQAFFEYQSLVARLTGMDLSNASHYDGATACVEAVLMACAATKRKKVLVAGTLNPQYAEVLATCLAHHDVEMHTVDRPLTNVQDREFCPQDQRPTGAGSCNQRPLPSGGRCDPADVESLLDDKTACMLVQHPNAFGILEEVDALSRVAHDCGAMFIVCVDPISLGLLKRPENYGADIVVAEGQPLGIPLSFGGPYLGILACRQSLVRRMPGRLVGETVDRRGKRCWVLTMQTREQHIRREKATSNICSNQGLMALRACLYLAALGPAGLREVAELCVRKSHDLAEDIVRRTPLEMFYPEAPFFKEFLLKMPDERPAKPLVDALAGQGIFAGIPQSDTLLVAVTEKRTREEMDRFVKALAAFFEA